jgi:hypothetical protein
MSKVRVIRTDGTREELEDRPPTLEEMQEVVGGYIEVVASAQDPDEILIVNEEGRLKDLPVNELASLVAQRVIVGDVVVLPNEYLE